MWRKKIVTKNLKKKNCSRASPPRNTLRKIRGVATASNDDVSASNDDVSAATEKTKKRGGLIKWWHEIQKGNNHVYIMESP